MPTDPSQLTDISASAGPVQSAATLAVLKPLMVKIMFSPVMALERVHEVTEPSRLGVIAARP